jgi:PAS domain-containing protein
MADKNWPAGSKNLIPAQALVGLAAVVVCCGPTLARSDSWVPSRDISALNPNVLWEDLIGGIVVCAFLAAIALWAHLTLRRFKRSHAHRHTFIGSALNSLSHGVVMTDSNKRIVYCNDRYLEIYGIVRAELRPDLTGPDLLEYRFERGLLGCSVENVYHLAAR